MSNEYAETVYQESLEQIEGFLAEDLDNARQAHEDGRLTAEEYVSACQQAQGKAERLTDNAFDTYFNRIGGY
jgi:hypothetical protein